MPMLAHDKDGNIDEVDYRNENVKNTGIEVSYSMNHDERFSKAVSALPDNLLKYRIVICMVMMIGMMFIINIKFKVA